MTPTSSSRSGRRSPDLGDEPKKTPPKRGFSWSGNASGSEAELRRDAVVVRAAVVVAAEVRAARRGNAHDRRIAHLDARVRSEERRVGKEGVVTCRSRGSPVH